MAAQMARYSFLTADIPVSTRVSYSLPQLGQEVGAECISFPCHRDEGTFIVTYYTLRLRKLVISLLLLGPFFQEEWLVEETFENDAETSSETWRRGS